VGAKISLSSIFGRFKMKTSPSEREKKTEKLRKERIALFNKANNLGSNGANMYLIVEYNEKYFIYNSRSDKELPPSETMLVIDIVFALSSAKGTLTARGRDIIRFQNGVPQMISVEE